jgi:hypothetical protein
MEVLKVKDPSLFSTLAKTRYPHRDENGEVVMVQKGSKMVPKMYGARGRDVNAQRMLFFQSVVLGLPPTYALSRLAYRTRSNEYVKAYGDLVDLFYNQYKSETDPDFNPEEGIDYSRLGLGYNDDGDAIEGSPVDKDRLKAFENSFGKSDTDYVMYLMAKAITQGGYSNFFKPAMLATKGWSAKRMAATLLMDERQLMDCVRMGQVSDRFIKDNLGFDRVEGIEKKVEDYETDILGNYSAAFNSALKSMNKDIKEYNVQEKMIIEALTGSPVSVEGQKNLDSLQLNKDKVEVALHEIKSNFDELVKVKLKYFERLQSSKQTMYQGYKSFMIKNGEDPSTVRIVDEKNSISALAEYRDYLEARYLDEFNQTMGDTFGVDRAMEFISIIDQILAWEDEPEGTEVTSHNHPTSKGQSHKLQMIIDQFSSRVIPNPYADVDEDPLADEEVVEDVQDVGEEDEVEEEEILQPDVQPAVQQPVVQPQEAPEQMQQQMYDQQQRVEIENSFRS